MDDDLEGMRRRSELWHALHKLAQGHGVQRDDLLKALDGELVALRRRLGLNIDPVDGEDDQKLRDRICDVIVRFLTVHVETLKPPKGRSPKQFRHAVHISFNSLLDKSHADLKRRDISERRAWLASEKVPDTYRVSIRTSQRYLDRAIDQIVQRLSDANYKPENRDAHENRSDLQASIIEPTVEKDLSVRQASNQALIAAPQQQSRPIALPPILPKLTKAAHELADAARRRYATERRIRQLHDPHPLPVRWTRGPAHLADHWVNVGSTKEVSRVSESGTVGEVVELFEALPSRRLVVLGRAGAGKTTLLLEFVLNFLRLKHQRDDLLVPVILPIASWNPAEQSLRDWLVARLVAEFPKLGKRTRKDKRSVAARLVEHGRVLPVLDGLDEMDPDLQPYALRALNAQFDEGDALVLTCRTEEYAEAVQHGDVLTAAAVIQLEDVNLDDVAGYLRSTTKFIDEAATRIKWDPVIERLRNARSDPPAATLLSALTTPLMVFLTRTIYNDTQADPMELLDTEEFADAWEITDHLLDSFVPAVYDQPPQDADLHKPRRWKPIEVEHWLGQLSIRALDKTRLLNFWNIRRGYAGIAIGIMFLAGLISGVSTLFFSREVGYIDAVLCGLFFGCSNSYVLGRAWFDYDDPEDEVAWTNLSGRMLVGVSLYGSVWRLGTVWEWIVLCFMLSIVGLFTTMNKLLGFSVGRSNFSEPRVFYRHLRWNALLKGMLAGLAVAGVPMLLCWLFFGAPQVSMSILLTVVGSCTLGNALISGWFVGLATRTNLALKGSAPWRLIAFLEDAHQRGVLRRTGFEYEFRHALLRDLLAFNALCDMPPRHLRKRSVLAARISLADGWLSTGQLDDAEFEFNAILEAMSKKRYYFQEFYVRTGLAWIKGQRGDISNEIADLRSILKDKRDLQGDRDHSTLETWGILIKVLIASGRLDEAFEEFASLMENTNNASTVSDNPYVQEAQQLLSAIYHAGDQQS